MEKAPNQLALEALSIKDPPPLQVKKTRHSKTNIAIRKMITYVTIIIF